MRYAVHLGVHTTQCTPPALEDESLLTLVDLALPIHGKGSSFVSDAPQGRLTPSAKGLHGYGEEGHGQGSGGASVRTLLSGLCVLGRRSVETAGPVELGLVGGHRVGDGHIRHEISGGTAGMTIICDDVQAKAGVFRVNGADGAGVALFLNNSDMAEEGGSELPRRAHDAG